MEIQQGQQQDKDEQEKRQQQRQQIYQSLALGLKQIRLLRLYPSSDPKSEIECELFIATLGKKSSAIPISGQQQIGYDALSYTWGDPAATQRIRLNNSAFFVTQNLCEALRQLRLATRPRVVWADACCINQEDNVEKASQVGMMFDIYLKATQTVVWLGACTMDIDPVFDLINKINDLGLYEQGQIVKVASIRNAALSLFEKTEWFQRTWVRQEIHAGRKVQIICGRYSCNFEDFQAVMDGL
ncbi:heterokaryon incompatibility protein-domain-containing protein, partial [Dactylonectria macrodidyma]